MTQFPVSTSSDHSIYASLELSNNSWLLAIQSPEIDFRLTPNSGHSEAHAGLPLLNIPLEFGREKLE